MSTPTSTLLSPYQAAKEINAQLALMKIEKVLPPQMIYTYCKKGYITSHVTPEGKIKIAPEDLATWFVKYSNSLNEKLAAKAQAVKLELAKLQAAKTSK